MNLFIQEIPLPNLDVSLSILRLDEIHPYIQGNKYYKLLYNVEHAIQHQLSIATFGGAFSNHIHATALACKNHNIPCIGIIRGNNFKYKSETLAHAEEMGMQLFYTDRTTFKTLREQDDLTIKAYLTEQYEITNQIHIIPEGGTNQLGIKGAERIGEIINDDYNIICCPVGTGGTIAGIINSFKGKHQILGFSSLKDEYLTTEVEKFTLNKYTNWSINYDYHFGGYAKWDKGLIHFINEFKKNNKIPLCPIYTGKMMFGLIDLIQKKHFEKGTKILAIHTGGLQGITGFNFSNKNILK